MMSELYTQEQKDQFFALLATYSDAVAKIRAALNDGCIDGTGYGYENTRGCVFGVVSRVYDEDPMQLAEMFEADEDFGYISAVEQLVYGIHEGDTPATNPVSALLVGWIDSLPSVDTEGVK